MRNTETTNSSCGRWRFLAIFLTASSARSVDAGEASVDVGEAGMRL
jgi:hypothetical protein